MSVIVAFAAIAGHAQDGKAILDTAARALGATNLTSIPYSGDRYEQRVWPGVTRLMARGRRSR